MRGLRPNVWHWQSPHPDWDHEQWWPELVSSYAIALGDAFLLFDPLSVPDALRERATAVILTAPCHERDARRLDLPVHTPPADTGQDWVEKFGVDPDRVPGMETEDRLAAPGRRRRTLPRSRTMAVRDQRLRRPRADRSHSLPAAVSAIVTGDSLTDFGDGLDIQLCGRKHVTREDVVRRLRPLLDLPIELVLPAHGDPAERAALERFLSSAAPQSQTPKHAAGVESPGPASVWRQVSALLAQGALQRAELAHLEWRHTDQRDTLVRRVELGGLSDSQDLPRLLAREPTPAADDDPVAGDAKQQRCQWRSRSAGRRKPTIWVVCEPTGPLTKTLRRSSDFLPTLLCRIRSAQLHYGNRCVATGRRARERPA